MIIINKLTKTMVFIVKNKCHTGNTENISEKYINTMQMIRTKHAIYETQNK